MHSVITLTNCDWHRGALLVAVYLFCATGRPAELRADEPATAATRRALDFLVAEVPAWPQQNHCFSCHNSGDGARALLTAHRRGWAVPDAALAETIPWLLTPANWNANGGNSDYNDQTLLNVQFGAALAALAEDRNDLHTSTALQSAAATLAGLQASDGSWAFEAEGVIGSPIGYGRPLTTMMTRDILQRADRERFAAAISRANAWLLNAEPRTVLDTAAVAWGLADIDTADATKSISRKLETIRSAQSDRGGWGPYMISAPEPFDTAVVLLALQQLSPTHDARGMIARGREFLIATQLPAGRWPATTRPAGLESYPHMISTTAWATLALVATEPAPAATPGAAR